MGLFSKKDAGKGIGNDENGKEKEYSLQHVFYGDEDGNIKGKIVAKEE